MKDNLTALSQMLIVMSVVGATLFVAIVNNDLNTIYSLCTACFGYYFGVTTTRGASALPVASK